MCVCFIRLILEARVELNIVGFLEELKLRKIASEIFWPLKTPNYLLALTNFWPVKVHVKSLGWKNTYPQVWRNVQIKKLGSILILLTKSVLDMDMKLISCSPESDNEFRFLNLWFFFTNLYDLLLICTWSLSFSKPALFQTWKKKSLVANINVNLRMQKSSTDR